MLKEIIIRRHKNGGFTIEEAVQKGLSQTIVAAVSTLAEVQSFLDGYFADPRQPAEEYVWPSPSLAEKIKSEGNLKSVGTCRG